jgi:uncharacterized protein YecT (DUF1311 family)
MIPDSAAPNDAAAPSPGADAFPTLDRTAAAAPPPRRQPFAPSRTLIAGAAAVVVLGLGLGFLLAPAGHVGETADPDQLEAHASDGDPHLQIEMNRKAPPSQPVPTGGSKIDAASTIMQPAGSGTLAPASTPAAEPKLDDHDGGVMGVLARLLHHDSPAKAPQETEQDAAPPPQLRQATQAPVQVYPPMSQAEQPVRPAPVVVAQARPSFDCTTARVRAEQIVCSDPQLAAADRRMARAFREARVAGVPYGVLAAQQQRWYRDRDRADTPEALAQTYDQRIAELQSQRDNAGQSAADDDGGGDGPRD